MAACIKCGHPVDDYIAAEYAKAKAKLGLKLGSPKVCSKCLWTQMLELAIDHDADDDDERA